MRACANAVVLAAVAASLHAAAGAQTRIRDNAARIPSSASLTGERGADAQKVLNAYAACVVKRSRRGVEAYLNQLPGTPTAGPALMKLMTDSCLDAGELKFKAPLIRGALFESLYRTDAKLLKPTNLETVAAIDYARGASPPLSDGTRLHLGLLDFSDCVVRNSPDGARELVTSKVASAGETVALGKLGQSFNACLSKDVELKFSRPILRGVVAEALYRLSAAGSGYPMFAKSN